MKSIVSDFKRGNATQRLAIASDLISITGVSLAAVLAPVFTFGGRLDLDALAGKSFFALFGLGVLSLLLAGIISAHSWLKTALTGSVAGVLLLATMWLFFFAVFIYAAYGLYAVLAYTHW